MLARNLLSFRAFRLVVAASVLGPALSLGALAGCAAVLGFEDTTLRAEGDESGISEAGADQETGTPPSEGGTSRLTTKPASLVVRRGSSADLAVDLARGSDVTGAVTVRLSDLPIGVAATTATLAPGTASGTLKLTATASATLGATSITVNADGTSLPPAKLPLLVADPAGSLDTTFDTDGFASDATRGAGTTFFSLALQADQKIIAAGAAGASPASLSGWVLRRFSTTGATEPIFTTTTSAAGVVPADGEARAVTLDAKGNIVCVGSSQAAPNQQLTIVRLLPSGALDTTFAGGVVRLAAEVPLTSSFGYGVSVQPDGAIVVVGSRRDIANNESGIILRFKSNGTRDATFNGGATIVVPNARFVGVATDATGVLAAGSTIGGALPSYFVTRRTAQGAPDPTFGSAGTAAFGNTYRANAFVRLADGSSAVVGDVQQGAAGYTAGVASAKGTAVFARAYANAAGAGFFGIAVQADGRIIAAGHTATPNGEARVQRILPDGNNDPTFGTAGTAVIEPAGTPNGFDVTLFAAAVQADGRILAAGNRSNAGGVLYRLWP